jgi:pantothenate kinase
MVGGTALSDNQEMVRALEQRLATLKSTLSYAHRAFVIEFAGTPKSGKSTSVEAIRHFFARNGFRVHVLAERAAVCPIPMKGHLFFNTWCASSMLAELLAKCRS